MSVWKTCNLDALFWPLGEGKMNSVNITSSLNDVISTLWQKKVKPLSRKLLRYQSMGISTSRQASGNLSKDVPFKAICVLHDATSVLSVLIGIRIPCARLFNRNNLQQSCNWNVLYFIATVNSR